MSAPGPSQQITGSVVPNSALSYLPAQAHTQGLKNDNKQDIQEGSEQGVSTERLVPAGVRALCEACSKLYPDQPNPLQVTTRLKYWLGGQDPLDYISMYWNPGKPELDIPPHWHYISFGISDLHGDGRVHLPADRVLLGTANPPPSGFGFELTMRAAGVRNQPPLWPAALLHSMARYVFATGNKLLSGDHISWHAPLDGAAADQNKKSRVRHLLVAEDPQLETIHTPHGTVSLLQLVGCTGRELRAAQRGSGFEVLHALAKDKSCGGPCLVTDVGRRRSARVGAAGGRPAHLAGVTAPLRWTGHKCNSPPSPLPRCVSDQIKETLQRGLSSMSTSGDGTFLRQSGDNQGHMSTDSFEMSSIERALPQIPEVIQESYHSSDEEVKYYESVNLTFNPEGAGLLPLAIEGRVRHGRHFTWRDGGTSVSLLSPEVQDSLVSARRPYAARGRWLQVLIPKELSDLMSPQIAPLSALGETDSETDSESERDGNTVTSPTLPITLSWPEYGLEIRVMNDYQIV